MSKISNNTHAVFAKTLRFRLRIHTREMLSVVCGLGVMILAPAVPAQKPPTPSSTTQNNQGVAQSLLTTKASTSAQQEPLPQQAPLPRTQEQAPANSPQVSYEAGQLTIIAENSKLSEVLSSLRACMGADIDLPASASGERIWARLGPGPARKILATLLSGTNLDYVIQASDSDPDGIRNVWLTRRTDAPAVTTARAGNSAGRPLPPRESDTNRRIPVRAAAEDRAPETTVSPEPALSTDAAAAPASPQPAPTDATVASAGTQPTPTDAAVAPTSTQPTPTDVATASATQGSDANKPSTNPTDQMVHTLQDMYEQRKQMQLARTPQAPN